MTRSTKTTITFIIIYSAVIPFSSKFTQYFPTSSLSFLKMEDKMMVEDEAYIQKQIELEEREQIDEALKVRARKWQQKRVKKFKQETKGRLVSMQNSDMPVEQLRKIVKDHGDMSSRKFRNDKRIYLGALKYGLFVSI